METLRHSRLHPLAFIDPAGGNRDAIEALFHKALRIVLASAAGATSRPPVPRATAALPPFTVPEEPLAEEEWLRRLEEALGRSLNPSHPGYMAHMDPIPTTASILGDLAASSLNNNMLSVELSPFLSRLEASLVQGFASLFGLGPKAGGMLLAGGTLANLQALAVARNAAFACAAKGISALSRAPVLFASAAAHTSIHKAAMVLGLGTDAVVPVPVDRASRMDAESLRRAIARARREDRAPFCVVASAGTTVTGSIDPLTEIGEAARGTGLWFHVDAVFGGALVLCEGERRRLAGIETADSIAFNPQKWLYVTKTSAMALFRDAGLLEREFRVPLPYMEESNGQPNYGEIGVQGTRYADSFKLWLSLLHLGRRGYEGLIDGTLHLTGRFRDEVKRRPYLELAVEPELNVVCFRGIPAGVGESERDAWNARLRDSLLRGSDFCLSFPLYRGRRWLRAVLLNPYLDESYILRLFRAVDEFAARTEHKPRGSRAAS